MGLGGHGAGLIKCVEFKLSRKCRKIDRNPKLIYAFVNCFARSKFLKVITFMPKILDLPKSGNRRSSKIYADDCRCTKPAFFDQCSFQLKHPETKEFMKKSTRVQTTSDHMFQALDSRFCNKQHAHAQIAGSCVFRGERMPLSRFASYYPRALARQAAQAVLNPRPDPLNLPSGAFVHEAFPTSHEEGSPSKRRRFNAPKGLRDLRAKKNQARWKNQNGKRSWKPCAVTFQSREFKRGTDLTWSSSSKCNRCARISRFRASWPEKGEKSI